jgi:serine O-acetyltransferase
MGLRDEIRNILRKDPAARSELEVLLCYPGLHAILLHRLAHGLWRRRVIIPARMISQFNRALTGIEIHPGAQIGQRVFIDHGMGVVIGETTVVGDDCVIYQAVTLGAGSDARKGEKTRGKKRHPTLGTGVIVGSGAEIQGPITVGDNVQVASGSIVLKDVPDNSVVVGVPGRVIYRDGERVREAPEEETVPDPEAAAIKALNDRVADLERRLEKLTGGDKCDAALSDPVDQFLHGAGI